MKKLHTKSDAKLTEGQAAALQNFFKQMGPHLAELSKLSSAGTNIADVAEKLYGVTLSYASAYQAVSDWSQE